MNAKQQKIVAGCLLSDLGKLLRSYTDNGDPGKVGYEYLKGITSLSKENEILGCVRGRQSVQFAELAKDDIAYISHIAGNIASAAYTRQKHDPSGGFVKGAALESVFNIINGNNQKFTYRFVTDGLGKKINYPVDEQAVLDESIYAEIISNISSELEKLDFKDNNTNALLRLLEANLTFVPSSADEGVPHDISLYDHAKLKAGFGLCIEHYLEENGVSDYKAELFDNETAFCSKKAFAIYSLDIGGGIQNFIYNIASEGALKGLRARSFYLEILMENCVDELLDRLELCRANVLYTGGGHAYMLLPNTSAAKETISAFEKELNKWLIQNFGVQLYAAGGYAECSVQTLQNDPVGSYKEIFTKITKETSSKKISRYTAADIELLNAPAKHDRLRECPICHRSDKLTADNKCLICSGLEKLSSTIISSQDNFFIITKNANAENGVIMPFGCALIGGDKSTADKQKQNGSLVRMYSKNKLYSDIGNVSNLWIGDYVSDSEFSKLAEKSRGIKRLGIIRADVDNLGQAFVSGFSGAYETIVRTAVFSRKLSMFFKLHINKLLQEGGETLDKKTSGKRNASIVYSGGDDLFIVGAWDDIIAFSIDLYDSLKRYSQGKLTISAGIGIYPDKFPIAAMAEQTGELEHCSKVYDNERKNAVTLFNGENTYHWDEFVNYVLAEKLEMLQSYIDNNDAHGKALLYNMLQLIRDRNKDGRINIARFTYLLARLRPDKNDDEKSKLYNDFSKKMYKWIRDDKDCRQLTTAIYIYVYMNRERTDDDE